MLTMKPKPKPTHADISPVARYTHAISELEARLAEAQARQERLQAAAAPDIVRAIEGGSDPSQATRHLSLAGDEVRAIEKSIELAREQLRIEQAKAAQADEARRWRETEALLTGDAADAWAKMQAGADLLIAGHRQFAQTFEKVREIIPKRPRFWPSVWAETLEGRIRQYIGARCGLLAILASERPAVLAGPDLKQLHAQAVREVLGDHHNPEEKAA